MTCFRPIVQRYALFAGTLTIALLSQVAGSGHLQPTPLVVSKVVLVESRLVDSHFVEDVYRAAVTHRGETGSRDFALVKARLVNLDGLSLPGLVEFPDRTLEFGTLRAGQTVESLDMITIRRHRRLPLEPHHLRWAVSARADVVFSEGWAGQWKFTITSRDTVTGAIVSEKTIVDSIGAGASAGLSLLPDFVRCRWSSDDASIEGRCATQVRLNGCLAEVAAEFTLEREDSRIEGHGAWQASQQGTCNGDEGTAGQSIELVAVRLSDQADDEPLAPGLLPKFVTEPELISALAASRPKDLPPRHPVTPADCARGGWRRFGHLALRSEHACAVFWQQGGNSRGH